MRKGSGYESFTLKKTPMNSMLLLEAMAMNYPVRMYVSSFADSTGVEWYEVRHQFDNRFSRKILDYISDNNIFKLIQKGIHKFHFKIN